MERNGHFQRITLISHLIILRRNLLSPRNNIYSLEKHENNTLKNSPFLNWMYICFISGKSFVIYFHSQTVGGDLNLAAVNCISSTDPWDGPIQIHALGYTVVCCLVRSY